MTNRESLTGCRVIEIGTMVAAPFAAHILSQLGAEIIKLEPPTGDTTRALVRGGPGGTLIAYSHSKKSLAIDLGTPGGQEVFAKLVATTDVLIHNLAPSAARKLGLTPEALAKANPKLISCHIRGYASGPQSEDLATNPVAEAATGVMDDHRIDGRPTRLGPSYHDQFAGAYAVIRILAALRLQQPTDSERHIEIGLYETGLHVAARDLAGVQLKTSLLGRPEKEAGGEFAMPGYGAYQSRDGRWLYLLVLTDTHWQKLTAALGMAEGQDPSLARLRDRKKQRDRVEAAVRHATNSLDADEICNKLKAAGVGFTEVLPIERVLETPQAQAPGKLRDVQFRGLDFQIPEFPGQAAIKPNRAPPELGEHSLGLLEELGFDDATNAALLESGAVRTFQPGDFAWAPVRTRE